LDSEENLIAATAGVSIPLTNYRIIQLRDWCKHYSVQALFSARTIWSAAICRRFRFQPTQSGDKSPHSISILS
jgi:hypothetical protein